MIVCIKHPKYDGVASPVLSCKTCCGKFIAGIKEQQRERETRMGVGINGERPVQPLDSIRRPHFNEAADTDSARTAAQQSAWDRSHEFAGRPGPWPV